MNRVKSLTQYGLFLSVRQGGLLLCGVSGIFGKTIRPTLPIFHPSGVRPGPMTESSKILIVEDNDFVRMQMVRYLQETGASVLEAPDARQALDFMRREEKTGDPITLAIVDVRMEPVDGFEFIKSIRGFDMDTPVILVTGDNNPDLLEKAGTWGVGAVMMKPVQKDRLLKTVVRTIEVYRKRSQ